MAEQILTRFTIERDGVEIALEPYENDRWDLSIDGTVVHSFVAERLNLKALADLLVKKGHLAPQSVPGMTKLADWKSFDIAPQPEDK